MVSGIKRPGTLEDVTERLEMLFTVVSKSDEAYDNAFPTNRAGRSDESLNHVSMNGNERQFVSFVPGPA